MGQSTGTKGWFKLDIEFLKITYYKNHSGLYKELIKNNIEDQGTEVYETFVVPFDKELINIRYEKPKPHMIYQSDAPAPEELVVCKKIDASSVTSSLSSSTGKSCLTGGTRVNVTPEKRIPKKHKYIKPTALSTFIPGNKILLKKYNDDNPETKDTSLSGKDDMSHTSKDDFTEKK